MNKSSWLVLQALTKTSGPLKARMDKPLKPNEYPSTIGIDDTKTFWRLFALLPPDKQRIVLAAMHKNY